MFDLGAKPLSHPIRKKAWHRALDGGRLWIIVSYKYSDVVVFKLSIREEFLTFAKVIPDRNCSEDESYIIWPWEIEV